MVWVTRCGVCGSEELHEEWIERKRTREVAMRIPCLACGSLTGKEVITELVGDPWRTLYCLECNTIIRQGDYVPIEDWD